MFFPFFKKYNKASKWTTSIQKKINYHFKNNNILEIACTHKSINSKPELNYERYELIGDSVINLVVTEWLSNQYPNDNEGNLTTKRASLVNTHFLSKISKKLKLDENIIISKGVDINNKIVSKNINADLYESIVGAIYIDSNYKIAENFILNTLIKNHDLSINNINHKGILIEYCHKKFNKPPIFNVISSKGPDHNKSFKVKVLINNQVEFFGNGKNIKDAEQQSSKNAIKKLKII